MQGIISGPSTSTVSKFTAGAVHTGVFSTPDVSCYAHLQNEVRKLHGSITQQQANHRASQTPQHQSDIDKFCAQMLNVVWQFKVLKWKSADIITIGALLMTTA